MYLYQENICYVRNQQRKLQLNTNSKKWPSFFETGFETGHRGYRGLRWLVVRQRYRHIWHDYMPLRT
jgi:hypothetical protein